MSRNDIEELSKTSVDRSIQRMKEKNCETKQKRNLSYHYFEKEGKWYFTIDSKGFDTKDECMKYLLDIILNSMKDQFQEVGMAMILRQDTTSELVNDLDELKRKFEQKKEK
ncbi:MAG: hypothetical protein NT116_05775 [Candidatus Parcubacteria bacterium]|nr:hypothetical protein [Candidatus Parcubacteria bacterium]